MANYLVTGGTGFVASWAIVTLLKRGEQVRTTVRSEEKGKTLKQALSQYTDTTALSFAVADLTDATAWPAAMRDIEFVLHIASPMSADDPDDEAAVMKPAVDGTLNVLKAAAAAHVKHVVMTSSLAAATPPSSETNQAIDESYWTDPTNPELNAYCRSKILAELAAWNYMKTQTQTAFTTVLPGAIFGPILQPQNTHSVQVIQQMIVRHAPNPKISFEIIDVQDLVDLEIRAVNSPAANGQRYNAISENIPMRDIAKMLKKDVPDLASLVRTSQLPDTLLRLAAKKAPAVNAIVGMLGRKFAHTNQKAIRELDWRPRPAETTVIDTAKSLKAFNLLS
ncbi:NAD-dependent epimerase/dehydratase family protein [Lacticaseibacillus yichunensis]|uniref:NAD-dependent epimerase/dehydratase family protein n=1 Tax=Lacticaseibacillus yichunensis TaxID=2486015 RepID=A0ABW4CLD1_9LACO|nr:NAD-dependent epimerase/dehydratase family protein [Lacticaseibacillus yichunensis]